MLGELGPGRADVVAGAAAVAACERAAQWAPALALLAGLPAVSTVTVNSAISACEKALRWEAALRLLARMQSHFFHH